MNLNDYSKAQQKQIIKQQTQDFLNNGGSITVLPPQLSPTEKRIYDSQNKNS